MNSLFSDSILETTLVDCPVLSWNTSFSARGVCVPTKCGITFMDSIANARTISQLVLLERNISRHSNQSHFPSSLHQACTSNWFSIGHFSASAKVGKGSDC